MIIKFIIAACLLPLLSCGQQSGNTKMNKAQRNKYYADYNNKYTQAQWDSIAKLNKHEQAATGGEKSSAALNSVAFSIKNKSVFSKTFYIDGNVLTVKSFQRNYYGFPAGTMIYAYEAEKADKKGKLLYTLSQNDEGKMLVF